MIFSTNPGLYVAQNTANASGGNYTCFSIAWKIAAQHFHAACAKIALYGSDTLMFVAPQAFRAKGA
jgi:hypothetical protein